MSGIAILNKESLEFKDAEGADGLRNSLGIYSKNSVQYNNADVFNFDGDGLNFVKKVTSSTGIPVTSDELVTKAYVDGVAVGLNVIKSCEVATVDNIDINAVLKNGVTLNGVSLVDGMRVLVWKQTDLTTNGIYVIDGENNAARSSDFDEEAEIKGGVHTFVTGGTEYVDSGFVVTNPNNELATVGASNIEWAQFSKSGVHRFTDGLDTATDGITVSVNETIARTADLENEVTRAEQAEIALADVIAAEVTRATAAEGANAAAIAAEVPRAEHAESAIATAIASEVTRAEQAESANATAIASEVTRAGQAESANATAIASEVTRATDAEGALATAITAEVTRAEQAEGANATAITAEVTRATDAEGALADKIDPSLGDGNRMVFVNSDGSALTSHAGFVYDNSGITVPNVTTTSDKTKKRDIKELSDSNLIYKLRPVEYKWKDENMDQRTKYGFIAQEVLEIFPSMVTKQDGVYGIEYINLISHLVKEVQILREEVNSMKN
jgi:hypothetical protein